MASNRSNAKQRAATQTVSANTPRDALAGVVDVHEADTLDQAVDRAYALARPSGVVLLAPACASFDMFRDYAERGRMFKDEVARVARAIRGGRVAADL